MRQAPPNRSYPGILFFPDAISADLAEVGGKALSLIRMARAGLPVPPGAVLTTDVFAPWFSVIETHPAWRRLRTSGRDRWPALCAELKDRCADLALTDKQRMALDACRERSTARGAAALFAVRSSSPEEDLASASFAGSYETCLGVSPAGLEAAVRQCFASSFDHRVLVYKEAHGFDVSTPRFAVVVQQQIASDVAGVAFSLNPLTNDYDEAVIDANWGLGESVVAGLASPDHFVVDKVTGRILEEKVGAKQVSIWLGADGGTVERVGHRTSDLTLDRSQLAQLTSVVGRIEALYGFPVDVEWTYASNRLYVLQARPITTYIPLPPEMLTKPGERRRLYQDAALSDGLTINAPISPMGLDLMKVFSSSIVTRLAGPVDLDVNPETGLMLTAGGRMYTNLSNAMWWRDPKALAERTAYLSAVTSEILAGADLAAYKSATRPSWMGPRFMLVLPRILWRLRPFFGHSLRAFVAPRRTRAAFQRKADGYEASIAALEDNLPLAELRRRHLEPTARHLLDVTLPPLVAFMTGMALLDRLVGRKSPELKALAERLKLGFSGNVVVEMGSALFRLAKQLSRSDFASVSELAERINRREIDPRFLTEWDGFLARFGARGPAEMDVASDRYGDDPFLALR